MTYFQLESEKKKYATSRQEYSDLSIKTEELTKISEQITKKLVKETTQHQKWKNRAEHLESGIVAQMKEIRFISQSCQTLREQCKSTIHKALSDSKDAIQKVHSFYRIIIDISLINSGCGKA